MSEKNEFLVIDSSIPSGMICWFYRSSAPEGYVICNGKWYSPDGSESSDTNTETCTVATPNLIDKYAIGATSNIGDDVEAGLPAFDGTFTVGTTGSAHTHTGLHSHAVRSGRGNDEWQCATPAQAITGTAGGEHTHDITVTYPTDSIFGKSNTVTPPSVKLLPCMKL